MWAKIWLGSPNRSILGFFFMIACHVNVDMTYGIRDGLEVKPTPRGNYNRVAKTGYIPTILCITIVMRENRTVARDTVCIYPNIREPQFGHLGVPDHKDMNSLVNAVRNTVSRCKPTRLSRCGTTDPAHPPPYLAVPIRDSLDGGRRDQPIALGYLSIFANIRGSRYWALSLNFSK